MSRLLQKGDNLIKNYLSHKAWEEEKEKLAVIEEQRKRDAEQVAEEEKRNRENYHESQMKKLPHLTREGQPRASQAGGKKKKKSKRIRR